MLTNHQERAHALLSASSGERWMNCTPSARAEEHIEVEESGYAKEGTLAHELGELELRLHFGLISSADYAAKLRVIEDNPLYSDDMPEYVDQYVMYCIKAYDEAFAKTNGAAEYSIEERIDLSEYIEEGFGNNDFVIVSNDTLEVVDLKYGMGVRVRAEDNTQLKLYALGALYAHRLFYDVKEIKITVIQPRLDSISSAVIDVEELDAWAEVVKERARLAYAGEGDFSSGSWCKFCKFKPKCQALMEANMSVIKDDFPKPSELSEDQIIAVYEKMGQIKFWVESIEEYMRQQMLKGHEFEGYKLVEGRGSRKWANQDEVANNLLTRGYSPGEIFTEPKLLGIVAIEKLLGKKNFEKSLGDLVYKSSGAPQIAKADDDRNDFYEGAGRDFDVVL